MKYTAFSNRLSLQTIGFLATLHLGASEAISQQYQCWGDAEILPGLCFPSPRSQPPEAVRVALYVRCRAAKGGDDEYTNNCCDHLRENDSQKYKVCREATHPIPSGLDALIRYGEKSAKVGVVCNYIDCEELLTRYILQ